MTLSQPLQNAESFADGRLIIGNDEYEIQKVDGKQIKLNRAPASSFPSACQILVKIATIKGEIVASNVKDNGDGTSTITIPDNLDLSENAFAGGSFKLEVDNSRIYKVLGNSGNTIEILNIYDKGQSLTIPSAGKFTLTAAEPTILHGTWLPTDLTDSTAKTKLQLWNSIPYAYFRRNETTAIDPPSYSICGFDVKEEPICISFDNLKSKDGIAVDFNQSLQIGVEYQADGINVSRVPTDGTSGMVVVIIGNEGHKFIYLNSAKKDTPEDPRGIAKIEFSFNSPLETAQIEGLGELNIVVNDNPAISGKIGKVGSGGTVNSVKFESKIIGSEINKLTINAVGEDDGIIKTICIIPGWKCVAIRPGTLSPNAKDVDIAGLRFFNTNPAVANLLTLQTDSFAVIEQLQRAMDNVETETRVLLKAISPLRQIRDRITVILEALPADATQVEIIRRLLENAKAPLFAILNDPILQSSGFDPSLINRYLDDASIVESSMDVEAFSSIHFPVPVARVTLSVRSRTGTPLNIRAYGGTTQFFFTNGTWHRRNYAD